MRRVIFKDVVKRVNINVDRHNTERLYYVGGEHIDSEELLVTKHGLIKGSTIGFKFHFGFNPGHILFMSRNPHLRKASMATFEGICSDSTYVVETRDKKILLQEYLLLEMQSDRFWNWAEANKSGGVNYLINYKTLDTYEFNLPSIDEQKVLAEKLWAAYEVKQSYLKMIDATDEMVKAQFVEKFYNENYPFQQLKSHIEVLRGVSYKPSDVSDEATSLNTIILRSNNIDNGQINFDDVVYVNSDRVVDNQLLSIGDIVMCGSNGSKKLVGKAAMIEICPSHPTSFGTFCLGIRCKETLVPKFLSIYFQTSMYREVIEFLGSGSNILNIKPEHIYNLEIPIPSISEQQIFVSLLNQADKSKAELRKSIDAIDKVIKSLINENL